MVASRQVTRENKLNSNKVSFSNTGDTKLISNLKENVQQLKGTIVDQSWDGRGFNCYKI